MNSPKPPVLATWLLEHMVIGENRQALAGDLWEQFSQHTSSAWYWRQVLSAIAVGLWRERRILWIAFGFTALWRALPSPLYLRLLGTVETSGFFISSVHLPWPLSFVSVMGYFGAMNGLPLLSGLCLYLAVTRSFSPRRLIRGLGLGLLALPFIAISELAFVSATRHWWAPQVGYALASLPLFASMLLSMWVAALPGRAGRLPNPKRQQA